MKRYSIFVRERGANREVELCQCETHPEALVRAAQDKFVLVASDHGSRKVREPKYEHVYFRENDKHI